MAELTKIYNYLPFSEKLITSGQPTRDQFDSFPTVGIQTVINLALPTSSNALTDEEEVVRSLGMEYIHIPVVWENPTKADLDTFFAAMEKQSEKKVWVHCAANMRVSAFVALYRILRLGWDHEKAWKDAYRIWDPFADPVWRKFIEFALDE